MFENRSYYQELSTVTSTVISQDLYEVLTVFQYISVNLTYSQTCLRGLKVLEIGCGAGEYCKLALDHGAEFVLGLDLSSQQINSAKMNLVDSDTNESSYSFIRADYFHSSAIEIGIVDKYSSYFDKAMSFWTLSMAKNFNELNEVIRNANKFIRDKGDAVFLVINPNIVEEFETFKDLPRIENMEFVSVEEYEDHFLLTSNVLEPNTGDAILKINYHVYSQVQLSKVFSDNNFEIKHSGPLDLTLEDNHLNVPFKDLSKEISKSYSFGWYIHVRKGKH